MYIWFKKGKGKTHCFYTYDDTVDDDLLWAVCGYNEFLNNLERADPQPEFPYRDVCKKCRNGKLLREDSR